MTQYTEYNIPIGWNVVTQLWDKFLKYDFIDTTLGPVDREYSNGVEDDYDWYLDE